MSRISACESDRDASDGVCGRDAERFNFIIRLPDGSHTRGRSGENDKLKPSRSDAQQCAVWIYLRLFPLRHV